MVNLNLKTQGTDASKAQPAMGTLAKATLTQPRQGGAAGGAGGAGQVSSRAGLVAVAALLLASAAASPRVDEARLLDPTPAPKLSDYGLFGPGRAAGRRADALHAQHPAVQRLRREIPLGVHAGRHPGPLHADGGARVSGRHDAGQDLRLPGRFPPTRQGHPHHRNAAARPPRNRLGAAVLCLERRRHRRRAETRRGARAGDVHRRERQDARDRLRRAQRQPVQAMPPGRPAPTCRSARPRRI